MDQGPYHLVLDGEWVPEWFSQTFVELKRQLEPAKRRVRRWVDELQSDARFDARSPLDQRLPLATHISPLLVLSVALFAQSFSEYVRSRHDGRAHVPPGTLVVMLANTVVFLKPGGVSSAAVCLAPYRIIERQEYSRILKSAFVHVDLPHLISNMRSVLESGTKVEELVGCQALLLDATGLLLLSQGLHVAAAWAENRYLGISAAYYTTGSVGFSSTCFALQIFAGYLEDDNNMGPPARFLTP